MGLCCSFQNMTGVKGEIHSIHFRIKMCLQTFLFIDLVRAGISTAHLQKCQILASLGVLCCHGCNNNYLVEVRE